MARPSTAARRYAEAVFELAEQDGQLDRFGADLALATDLLANESVARIVDNPARPIADRRALLAKLFDGRVSKPVQNLVGLLAERGRIETLPAVASEYARLLNRRRGIVEALVTSAAPLTAAELDAIRRRVEEMSGAKVVLETQVDESLIGGLTIRVGDRLLDASVRGRLERLREQLVSRGRVAR